MFFFGEYMITYSVLLKAGIETSPYNSQKHATLWGQVYYEERVMIKRRQNQTITDKSLVFNCAFHLNLNHSFYTYPAVVARCMTQWEKSELETPTQNGLL